MEMIITRVSEKRITLQAQGTNTEIMDLAAYLSVWSKSLFLPERQRIGFEFVNGGLDITMPESNDGFERAGSILENALTGWDRQSLVKLYKNYIIERRTTQARLIKEREEEERIRKEKEEQKALEEISQLEEKILKDKQQSE